MLDNKFVTIDNIYHRQISDGCILCIYGDYYLSSYWYVYEKDKNNLLTIIQLDTHYKPTINPSKILKVKAKDIDYMIISNPKSKLNFINKEVNIPSNFFKNYYNNRLNTKLPKYGDILLVEQNFFSYGAFFVLNYEPHNYSYLIYNINKCKTESIFIELCKYTTITTKELRRQIYDKSEKIRIKNRNTNYEILNQIDERIYFQTKMNYLFDTGINNACLGLMQLGFLNESLTSLTGKINQELNIIEEKNNAVMEYIHNYQSDSEDEQPEPYFENISNVNENIQNLITNDENFINTYLYQCKYSELNQMTVDSYEQSSYDENKSSSDGDTIDYPEDSYDQKYNNYIEDSYDSYEKYNDDNYNGNQRYNDDISDEDYESDEEISYDSYTGQPKFIENIYENEIEQNSNISYIEQEYITRAFDSYEEDEYIATTYKSDDYIQKQIYNEKENYENNLDLKVDELYNYFNTIERKLILDDTIEQIINTPNDNEMPPLIEIEYYEMNNISNKTDKEIEELTNLFNNCKIINNIETPVIESTINEIVSNQLNNIIEVGLNQQVIIEDKANVIEVASNEQVIIEDNANVIEVASNEQVIIEDNIANNQEKTINSESVDDYETITYDEIEPISRESCSMM
jgi:hypothetical protein